MKALVPSLRERKRYVAFEVISRHNPAKEDAMKALYESAAQAFGELGTAKMAMKFISDKWSGSKGIVRINKDSVNQMKAVFCLVDNVKGNPVIIRSLGVSGTLKKAGRNYLQ